MMMMMMMMIFIIISYQGRSLPPHRSVEVLCACFHEGIKALILGRPIAKYASRAAGEEDEILKFER